MPGAAPYERVKVTFELIGGVWIYLYLPNIYLFQVQGSYSSQLFFSTVLNGVQHLLSLICFPGGLQGNGTVTKGEQLLIEGSF